MIDSKQMEWAKHPKHPQVWVKDIITGERDGALSLHRVRVEPGAAISLHTHENQTEIFFLLLGEGMVTLGEEEVAFGPGCCGRAPAGLVHGLENKGSEDLEILAIFVPPLG